LTVRIYNVFYTWGLTGSSGGNAAYGNVQVLAGEDNGRTHGDIRLQPTEGNFLSRKKTVPHSKHEGQGEDGAIIIYFRVSAAALSRGLPKNKYIGGHSGTISAYRTSPTLKIMHLMVGTVNVEAQVLHPGRETKPGENPTLFEPGPDLEPALDNIPEVIVCLEDFPGPRG
jgi:hypothetical protein